MRVLLAGGGTGGHIYPALAVAEKLKTLHPECEILYIGTKKGLENKIVQTGNSFSVYCGGRIAAKIKSCLF